MGLNGLEPSTSRLSGVRSNQLSYAPINWKRPIFINNKAGDENRTRDNSLEGCGFTTKLHPHIIFKWRGTESNCRHKELQSFALPTELPSQKLYTFSITVLAGFEPAISCVTGRRDNPYTIGPFKYGGYRVRTCDPLLVRQMLSQLS